ncbi:MAG: peptidylprolyl isomerase, partial [Bacteroidales bacterium]|nr:peptidylprolyl isomerase [Bacteroidales bacterium]
RIVRLVKRHEPHKANNNDDYDLLKNIVENQKRKQLLDDWIRARQKETYVVITPEWQRCDFEYKGWIQ